MNTSTGLGHAPFTFLCLRIGLALLLLGQVFSVTAAERTLIPDFYTEPGTNPFRESVSANVTENIDPLSGNLNLSYVDLVVPGNGGLDIKVQRSYNSSNVFVSHKTTFNFPPQPNELTHRTPTGMGWTLHFGRVLKTEDQSSGQIFGVCLDGGANNGTNDNAILELPDGSKQLLLVNATGFDTTNTRFITKEQWVASCITGTPGGLLVISPDGTKYTMNHHLTSPVDLNATIWHHAWYTTRIEDRNGNWINIAYDTVAESQSGTGIEAVFDRITSSDGRTVGFTYTNRTVPISRRLARISANGQTWQYNYSLINASSGHYQLTQVTTPEPSIQWNYRYHTISTQANFRLLKEVTYPHGAKVNYTYKYQCMQAAACTSTDFFYSILVASKANSGPNVTTGTWTYTYAPGVSEDVTTVTLPGGKGKIQYHHFGTQAVIGNSTVCGQTLWKMGLLQRKQTFNGSATTPATQEIYTWEALNKISNEKFVRPPYDGSIFGVNLTADCDVRAPVLTQKQVIQDGTTYTTTFSDFETTDGSYSPKTIVESGQANRTILRTYFPRNAGQNIVGLVEDEDFRLGGICIGPDNPICQPFNGSISRTFNAKANLTSIVHFGVLEKFSYYSSGDRRTRTIFPDGVTPVTWNYGLYKRGIPLHEDHPEGIAIDHTVNNTGTIATETNGRRQTTNYAYDGLNRLIGINRPIGSPISIGWTGTSRTVTRGAYQQVTTFDGFGRPTFVSTSDTARLITVTQDINHDVLGYTTFESYPSSASGTAFTNDVLGRVTRVDNQGDGGFRTLQYLSGNRTTITNERGFATTFTYRSFGDPSDRDLMRIDAPEGVSTVFVRNILGTLLTADQGGVTRSYVYNGSNFLVSEANPETGTTTYGRDAIGNMTSRQIGDSGVTTYGYDGLSRLRSVNYPGATPAVSLQYDGNDNLTQAVNGVATWTYGYDANDNLTTETLSIDGQTLAVLNAYDALDFLTSMTYPSARVISYNPDALGRPTVVSPYVTGVSHHPNGIPSTVNFANGHQTVIGLNGRQWISNTSTASLVNLTYTYDGRGNVLGITDTIRPSTNRSLGYDGIDRLTNASGIWGAGTIGYDPTGNIQSMVLGAATMSYVYAGNRLASVSGARNASFSYDVYGNITANEQHSFAYDDAGNLRTVSGLSSAAHLYDANNRRVRAQKAGGAFTYSLYAKNGNLLGEYDATGFWLKEYAYLGGKLVGMVFPNPNNILPTANAGPPQTVDEQVLATLNGAGSSDSDGTIVSYAWAQTAGPAVALSNTASSTPTFTSPAVLANTPLTFALTVRDNDGGSASASVTVTVRDSNPDNDADGLPDAWELLHFGNITSQDAAGDPDADSLTNLQEFQVGTNPTDPDTDNDGVSDGQEVANGSDPLLNLPAILVIIQQLLLSD